MEESSEHPLSSSPLMGEGWGGGEEIKENGVADEQSLRKISIAGHRIQWVELLPDREFQYANPSFKET